MAMPRIGYGSPTAPTSRHGPAFSSLAVVLDAYRRRIVGWAMATLLKTELVLGALNMALGQRKPTGGDSPLRSGQPIHLARLRAPLRRDGQAPLARSGAAPLPIVSCRKWVLQCRKNGLV